VSLAFLSKLGLDDDEYRKLANLGASTPAALLGVRRAAPKAFDDLLGATRAREVTARLESLLTSEELERQSLAQPPNMYPLGAMLGTKPEELPRPKYDIVERDRLFNELRSLRQSRHPSQADKMRMAELERRLNALLESR